MNDGPKWSQLTGISMLACHADAGQCHSVLIRHRSVWQDEISTGALSSSLPINRLWYTWTYKIVVDENIENITMRRLYLSRAHLNLSPVVSYSRDRGRDACCTKIPEGKDNNNNNKKKLLGKREKTPCFKSKVFIFLGFNSNRDSVILCDTKAQSFL